MPENKLKELKLVLTHEEAIVLKKVVDLYITHPLLNNISIKLLLAETEALDKLRNEVGRGGV